MLLIWESIVLGDLILIGEAAGRAMRDADNPPKRDRNGATLRDLASLYPRPK